MYGSLNKGRAITKKVRISILQIGNVVAFIAVLLVNGLAGGTRLLNGRNTADVSAAYPTPVTPAGFTFSIWGIIYVLLLGFIVYQLLPRHREDSFNQRVSYLFILSSAFNISWLFLWQYNYIVLSVPLIFGLLITLAATYIRLNIGRSSASRNERIFVHLPFSVYLGWITIASIADVSSALVSLKWSGLAPVYWGVLVIVVALVIALAVLTTRRDIAYGLVLIWALSGIAANQSTHPIVVDTAEASILVIAAMTLIVVFLKSRIIKGV
jgi:translocator protein